MKIDTTPDQTIITIAPPGRGWMQRIIGLLALPVWILGMIEFTRALVETPDVIAGIILLGIWVLPFGWHLFRSLVPLQPETLILTRNGLQVDFGIGPFSMVDASYLKAVKHYWRDYFLSGRRMSLTVDTALKLQLVDLGGSVTMVLDDNGKEKHFARYALPDEKRQIMELIRRFYSAAQA